MLVIFNEDIISQLNNFNDDIMEEIRKLDGQTKPFYDFINIKHDDYGTRLQIADVHFKFKYFEARFFFYEDESEFFHKAEPRFEIFMNKPLDYAFDDYMYEFKDDMDLVMNEYLHVYTDWLNEVKKIMRNYK